MSTRRFSVVYHKFVSKKRKFDGTMVVEPFGPRVKLTLLAEDGRPIDESLTTAERVVEGLELTLSSHTVDVGSEHAPQLSVCVSDRAVPNTAAARPRFVAPKAQDPPQQPKQRWAEPPSSHAAALRPQWPSGYGNCAAPPEGGRPHPSLDIFGGGRAHETDQQQCRELRPRDWQESVARPPPPRGVGQSSNHAGPPTLPFAPSAPLQLPVPAPPAQKLRSPSEILALLQGTPAATGGTTGGATGGATGVAAGGVTGCGLSEDAPVLGPAPVPHSGGVACGGAACVGAASGGTNAMVSASATCRAACGEAAPPRAMLSAAAPAADSLARPLIAAAPSATSSTAPRRLGGLGLSRGGGGFLPPRVVSSGSSEVLQSAPVPPRVVSSVPVPPRGPAPPPPPHARAEGSSQFTTGPRGGCMDARRGGAMAAWTAPSAAANSSSSSSRSSSCCTAPAAFALSAAARGPASSRAAGGAGSFGGSRGPLLFPTPEELRTGPPATAPRAALALTYASLHAYQGAMRTAVQEQLNLQLAELARRYYEGRHASPVVQRAAGIGLYQAELMQPRAKKDDEGQRHEPHTGRGRGGRGRPSKRGGGQEAQRFALDETAELDDDEEDEEEDETKFTAPAEVAEAARRVSRRGEAREGGERKLFLKLNFLYGREPGSAFGIDDLWLLAPCAEELTAPLFVRSLWHGPSQADQTGTLEVRVVQPGPFLVRTGLHVLALHGPNAADLLEQLEMLSSLKLSCGHAPAEPPLLPTLLAPASAPPPPVRLGLVYEGGAAPNVEALLGMTLERFRLNAEQRTVLL